MVEQLEPLTMLTGVSVVADAPSYIEGQTAWFTFTLDQPAPQAFQVDLLVSGGPAGPTGYVMPISQGQTSAHVDFPTSDNSTPGDSYTLNLAITGTSEAGGPAGPFDSAATNILDNDYSGGGSGGGGSGPSGPGGGGSGPSGPSGPTSITLNQPDDAYEGTYFEVTGTISPPGYYSFEHYITDEYDAFQYDYQTGNFSVMVLIDDDGPSPPGDETPKEEPHTLIMSVWSGSPGSAVSNWITVTVHNVDPRLKDLYYGDPEDDYLLIDIYDYPPGGPNFVVSGYFLDDGSQDEHLVTITWGDDSAPTEFIPEDHAISASHHYEPDGGSYTITVTVTDDDTGFTSHSETINMYRLDLDNDADHNGAIDEDDDPIENVEPGAYVALNGDDDNANGILDFLEEGPISGEDDLEPILNGWSPTFRPDPSVLDYTGWHVLLTVDPPPSWDSYEQEFVSAAMFYTSQDKSGFVPFESTFAGWALDWVVGTDEIPSTLYVEARSAGVFRLQLELLSPGGQFLDADPVAFTVLPTVSVQASDATESGDILVTVSLSHPISEQVSVDFAVEEGTATSADYHVDGLPPGIYNGTITFEALESLKTILITPIDDYVFEDDEWLRVVTTNPVNAILSDQWEALPRILDNDPFVVISQVNLGIEPLTNAEQRYATFTIEMLGVESGPGFTDVGWSTFIGVGDTAVADEDFQSAGGTVRVYFQEPVTIDVALLHDSSLEDFESFQVKLTGTTNDIVILKDSGAALIYDPSTEPDQTLPPNETGAVPGREVLLLQSNKGSDFWEGDTVTFTASLSSIPAPPNEAFVWEYRPLKRVIETTYGDVKKYGAWQPFPGAGNAATATHTFSEPFIGQVRVQLTSGNTVTRGYVDVRAKAAYIANFNLSSSQPVGGHLEVYYDYVSPTGRPEDLDGVEAGEFVWHTPWGKWWGEYHHWPSSYAYPKPFDFTEPNGFHQAFGDMAALPLRIVDRHGKGLRISEAGDASTVVNQYYWYTMDDAYRHPIQTSNLERATWGGDEPAGKLRSGMTITYTIHANGNYSIVKRIDTLVEGQIQLSLATFPWTAP